jgi:hypothetical protein
MKLTREQISNLNDAELNRAMHEHYWVINSGGQFDEFFNSIGADKLNYLTDYNLTMPLFIESRLWIQPSQSTANGWVSYDDSNYSSVMVDSPLRAICEVLVMIAMEAKQ